MRKSNLSYTTSNSTISSLISRIIIVNVHYTPLPIPPFFPLWTARLCSLLQSISAYHTCPSLIIAGTMGLVVRSFHLQALVRSFSLHHSSFAPTAVSAAMHGGRSLRRGSRNRGSRLVWRVVVVVVVCSCSCATSARDAHAPSFDGV